jgi:hypothetical protein
MTAETTPSPLDTAYLLIERAGEQIEELKSLHDLICAAQAEATVITANPDAKVHPNQIGPFVTIKTGDVPIPPKCRILIGEISNSVRSALNYLVARLSELHTGAKVSSAQFPIESTPKRFKGRRGNFLRGVSDAHAAAIERLQPYNRVEWTTNLQRLSNIHKHDDLVLVTHDYIIGGQVMVGSTKPDSLVETTVSMQIKPALRIALGDGLPVIESLEVIKSQATKVLDTFKTEF